MFSLSDPCFISQLSYFSLCLLKVVTVKYLVKSCTKCFQTTGCILIKVFQICASSPYGVNMADYHCSVTLLSFGRCQLLSRIVICHTNTIFVQATCFMAMMESLSLVLTLLNIM